MKPKPMPIPPHMVDHVRHCTVCQESFATQEHPCCEEGSVMVCDGLIGSLLAIVRDVTENEPRSFPA